MNTQRQTALICFGMAIACLTIAGWMTATAAHVRDAAGSEQIELLSTWGFIVFAVGGVASLVSALPIPWYVFVKRATIAALVAILIAAAVILLTFIPRSVEQIWWVRQPVIAHQLKPDGSFDPNKPFKILNPDGSQWLVPSGKFVPANPEDPLAVFLDFGVTPSPIPAKATSAPRRP